MPSISKRRLPRPLTADRSSKLDPFKEIIAELLRQDPDANAPVIAQRLKPHGYDGGFTIVKDYLRTLRKNSVARRAYVRVESHSRKMYLEFTRLWRTVSSTI